jgi:hypothetical protein
MRRLTILLGMLLSLVAVPAAHAYSSPEVGMSDDRIMLKGSDAQIVTTVAQWQSMGVDSVRIFARWEFIAPQHTSKKMPAGFDPSNPADPRYNWGPVDRAVNAARGGGLKVYLTISGSGPLWGMSSPSHGNKGRRNPSPSKYGQFAAAVAKRYGSQVDTYILWNEPNHVDWLQDQGTCKKKHKCVEHSPHLYRRLVNAAEPKVRAADPGSTILIGALAPSGTALTARNKSMRPLQFLRAFGCVNKKYQRIRTGECKNFKPATADGFAYHPHGIRLAPNKRSPNHDDAQMADLSRLTGALDKITRKGGFKVRGAKRFPLYLTEWAYQTNPPDKYAGVSQSLQAKYMRQGAYLAWKNSRVRNLTQYVYVDEPGSGSGWQSGLFFTNGTPKLSLAVFPNPFWAQKIKKGTVQLWGQVRPGSGARSAQLQRRSGNTWVTISTVSTNAAGYYYSNVSNLATTTYRAITPAGTTATTTIFGR